MKVHSYQPTPHFHGVDWKDVKSNDNIRNEGSSERIVLNVIFDFFFFTDFVDLGRVCICVYICVYLCVCL